MAQWECWSAIPWYFKGCGVTTYFALSLGVLWMLQNILEKEHHKPSSVWTINTDIFWHFLKIWLTWHCYAYSELYRYGSAPNQCLLINLMGSLACKKWLRNVKSHLFSRSRMIWGIIHDVCSTNRWMLGVKVIVKAR